MKKLHIVLACSLLAVGCQKNLQAWGFGEGEAAKATKKTVDPAKENKKTENDNAQRKAEQDRIAKQNKAAENRMNDQAKNVKSSADNLSADSLKKSSKKNSSPTSSSWNLSSWFTSAERPEAKVTAEKLQADAESTSREIDPEKKAAQTESIVDTAAQDIEQALGTKTTEADKAQFTKTAESWLKNWSLESFTNWISSCYDWVFSRSSSVEPVATQSGSFNLADARDSNSSIAQPQESTLGKSLENRGKKLSDLSNQSTTIKENASDFQNSSRALLEQQRAKAKSWNLFQ
ncbi:hypothetical protein [Candidatus Chromulinivorax destructor]|uniref:Lipoprotein n=1 Tax=Candidatus Chromulinivorax destructor TaxID=2066483 RepID=A0A345ZCR9_9BACT|nr:hypothetical protein [Candidatus Chromulinivorax destructor]AXK61086.1 hypothetical protein C0J27_05135 [Candidatus Chromulinivorax destructor]